MRLGKLGADTKLSSDVRLYVPRAIHIGSNTSINDFVHIWGGGGVMIGSNTLIAAHTVITSQSHDVSAAARNVLYRDTDQRSPVAIGNNVWIGSNATILPGVTIGDGAVVAAGAVVTRDVSPYQLVAGCPAKVLRTLK